MLDGIIAGNAAMEYARAHQLEPALGAPTIPMGASHCCHDARTDQRRESFEQTSGARSRNSRRKNQFASALFGTVPFLYVHQESAGIGDLRVCFTLKVVADVNARVPALRRTVFQSPNVDI